MKQKRSVIASLILSLCTAIALLVSGRGISAQNHQKGNGDREEPPPPVYNPYPPGILPADLESEIARVLREIDVIEGRAIERWHSLPLPTRLGMRPGPNPPVVLCQN